MLLFEENWEKYHFLAVSVLTATAEMFIRRWPGFPHLHSFTYVNKQKNWVSHSQNCCIFGSIRMNILMLDTRNVEQTKDVRMYT